MKALLVGQAPARSGNGRPFTGPSGDRLVKLLGLDDYEELADCFELTNLLPQKQLKRRHKGDVFDLEQARRNAAFLLDDQMEPRVVISCGRLVYKCLTGQLPREWFDGVIIQNNFGIPMRVYAFPHPSGVSHWWNSLSNRQRAERWIRQAAKLADQ